MNRSPEHERLRRLVLAWEELDDSERTEAEAHLSVCPACRALKEAFERHERAPGPLGELPASLLDSPPALAVDEQAAEAASRAALAERLGLAGTREARAPARRERPLRAPDWRWTIWLAPAAAAAAVMFVWLGLPRPMSSDVIEEVAALRPGVVRGGAGAAPDSVWHSGDALELRVRLSRGGWPAVVLVDPLGEVTLLRPAAGDTARIGAGAQRIAPADPEREWVLEGPAGTEDLIVAVRTGARIDRAALERDLGAIDRGLPREGRLAAVRRALEHHVGPTRRIALAHR